MSATATNPARWISGDRLTGVAMLAAGAAALYAGWRVYQAITWARAEIQETADENPGGVLDTLRTDATDPDEAAAFCDKNPDHPDCRAVNGEIGWLPNWSNWGDTLGID